MSERALPLRHDLQGARAIACVLLVLFHVIGGDSTDGLRLRAGSDIHQILSFLSPLRMPLFAMISGCVYAMRPVSRGSEIGFLTGKVRRILLPLLTVSTVFYAAQVATGVEQITGAISRLPSIYVYSYAIFWFLQAIFLIFVFMSFADRFLRARPKATLLLIIILVPLEMYTSRIDFFSFWGFVFLLPYFLSGTLITRYPHKSPSLRVLLVGLLLSATIHGWYIWFSLRGDLLAQFARFGMGLCGGLLIIKAGPTSPALKRIGAESFPIYLLHIFFVVGSRIGVSAAGGGAWLQFLAGLVCGLGGPMLTAWIVRKSSIGTPLILGERPNRPIARAAAN